MKATNGNRTATSNTLRGIDSYRAYYDLNDSLEEIGPERYAYDEDGYIKSKSTSEGTTTYDYGSLGELKEVVLPNGDIITYRHNANNQRVAKLKNGEVVEKYLWLNLTTLLAVYDKDDKLLQRFEYADGRMPLSFTDSSGDIFYLSYNQIGSPRAVTDEDGNILKTLTYDSFGTIIADSNPTFKIPFGFAGGLYDSDTKLTRFDYRDYDASTGKWTAKDPIGFDGGDTNLYGYVLGDPVNFTDSKGLFQDPRFNGRGVPNAMGGNSQSSNVDGGVGTGISGHLGLLGGSYYEYITYGDSGAQRVSVSCARLGIGILGGTGIQATSSVSPSVCTDDKKECVETWSVGGSAAAAAWDLRVGGGVSVGPSGLSGTLDGPGIGAGIYAGVDVCVIKSCPL